MNATNRLAKDGKDTHTHSHTGKCKAKWCICTVNCCILSRSLLTGHLPKILNIQKRQQQRQMKKLIDGYLKLVDKMDVTAVGKGRRGRNDSLTNCHHISANRQLIPVLARPIFDCWCQLNANGESEQRQFRVPCCWQKHRLLLLAAHTPPVLTFSLWATERWHWRLQSGANLTLHNCCCIYANYSSLPTV